LFSSNSKSESETIPIGIVVSLPFSLARLSSFLCPEGAVSR